MGMNTTQVAQFENLLHDLRSIEEQQLTLDGGRSLQAFGEAGDKAFNDIDAFLAAL
jgi:hypothetical protein